MNKPTDYIFETLDTRPGWHTEKTVKNIINIETTHKHFILTTIKNKKIKLRTDTWHPPRPVQAGQGWHELPDASGKAPEHVAASKQLSFNELLREPMVVASNHNIIHSDKPWMKLFYGAVLDYARDYFGLHEANIELRFRIETIGVKKGQVNLNNTENIITVEDGGIENNIKFILHEFTHLKQKIRKESTFEKRGNQWMLLWKGEPVVSRAEYNRIWKSDKEYNRYKELPWEAEAIEMGTQVQNFFNSPQCKSLIGKDPSIDYILTNRLVLK